MAVLDHNLTSTLSKVFPELSSTESHILLFYCSGFTVDEISIQFIIGKKTVNSHLSNIKTKYGIGTCFELRTYFYLKLCSKLFREKDDLPFSMECLYPHIDLRICDLMISGLTTREISLSINQPIENAKAAETSIYKELNATTPKSLRRNILLRVNESLLSSISIH